MPLMYSVLLWLVGYVCYTDMEQSDKTGCIIVSVLITIVTLLTTWFKG